METESRYSGKRAAQGCSLSLAIMVATTLLLSLIVNRWLGLTYSASQKTVELVFWLIAISVGGYFAARLGKTTGWTNSLLVGFLAAIFFLVRVWDRVAIDDGGSDPVKIWLSLAACLLSVPAAILGGVLWERTSETDDLSSRPNPDQDSKPANQTMQRSGDGDASGSSGSTPAAR